MLYLNTKRYGIILCLFAFVALSATFFISCKTELEPTELESRVQQMTQSEKEMIDPLPSEIAYKHPLQKAKLQNGLVPGLDFHDTTTGNRYAVEVSGSDDDNLEPAVTSGLMAYEVTPLTQQDWDDAHNKKNLSVDPYKSGAHRIGEPLAAYLDQAPSSEPFTVSIWLKEDAPIEHIVHTLEREAAMGRINTLADYRNIRQGLLQKRRDYFALLQKNVLNKFDGKAEILRGCELMPCVVISTTKEKFSTFIDDPSFERFDLPVLELPEANTVATSRDDYGGVFNLGGLQLQQFFNNGFDGGRKTSRENIVPIAIHEAGPTDLTHFGFYDWTGGPSNILGSFGCRFDTFLIMGPVTIFARDCAPEHIPEYGSAPTLHYSRSDSFANHANSMAGLAFASTIQGQDIRLINSNEDFRYFSGFSREAGAYLVYTHAQEFIDKTGINIGDSAGFLNLLRQLNSSTAKLYDWLIGQSPKPALVSISQGMGGYGDPKCTGEDYWSRTINRLYEYGILPIKSAGNQSNRDFGDCTVTAPGSAIGAFTVGEHSVLGGSVCDTGLCGDMQYNGDISEQTSRGGNFLEGRGRTIVDIVAQGRYFRNYQPAQLYNVDSLMYGISLPNASDGSSNSAAIVSGTATAYIDFFQRTWPKAAGLIDDPGILFASLLLMGDRTNYMIPPKGPFDVKKDQKAWTGYDNLWGAGRYKMRMFNGAGMDGAAEWAIGRTCVGHGEKVRIPVNRAFKPVPSSANDFKAVAYWYDRRHERGEVIDDIDLVLTFEDNGDRYNSWGDFDAWDNKARVYDGAFERFHLVDDVFLELRGYDVTNNETICGKNKALVYYAYFYEDNARNDANGPDDGVEIERDWNY